MLIKAKAEIQNHDIKLYWIQKQLQVDVELLIQTRLPARLLLKQWYFSLFCFCKWDTAFYMYFVALIILQSINYQYFVATEV